MNKTHLSALLPAERGKHAGILIGLVTHQPKMVPSLRKTWRISANSSLVQSGCIRPNAGRGDVQNPKRELELGLV